MFLVGAEDPWPEGGKRAGSVPGVFKETECLSRLFMMNSRRHIKCDGLFLDKLGYRFKVLYTGLVEVIKQS